MLLSLDQQLFGKLCVAARELGKQANRVRCFLDATVKAARLWDRETGDKRNVQCMQCMHTYISGKLWLCQPAKEFGFELLRNLMTVGVDA